MEKNPFEVLGMDSGIVRKLNDVQIVELAKGQYRTLAGFYHPDKGGKEEDFREIAEAYRTFDNFPKERELFRFWKEKHLKRTGLKKKAGELEEALDAARKGQVVLIEQLGEYLAQYAFGKTAFCTRGREFSMQDYANSLNLSSFVKGTCSRDLLFYKLRVKDDGSIEKEKRGKIIEFPERRLIGSIGYDESREYGGILSILKKAQAIWTPEQENVRRRLGGNGEKKTEIYEGRMSPREFRKIIPFLTPRIRKHDYVFSIDRDGGKIFFNLEGKVVEEKII